MEITGVVLTLLSVLLFLASAVWLVVLLVTGRNKSMALGALGISVVGFFAGIILLGTASNEPGSSVAVQERVLTPKPTATARPAPTPVPQITVVDLLAAYEANEIASDIRFKSQIFDITGEIGDFKVGLFNTKYMTLTNGERFSLVSVNCSIDDEDAEIVATLEKGQTVTIRGRIDGLILFSVEIDDCRVREAPVLVTSTPAATPRVMTTNTPVPLAPTTTSVPTATPDQFELATKNPGMYEVGVDLQPGIYAGRAGKDPLDSCYWARLRGASGDLDDLIANGNAVGQFYLEVQASDRYLEIQCTIVPVEWWPVPSSPLTKIESGTYIVGRDIAPGTYGGQGGQNPLGSCYWARLSGLSGGIEDLIANGNGMGQFFVNISPTDTALSVTCTLTFRGN